MDRHWLLTWTMYGTWLPGDRRGFVGRTRVTSGRQIWQNVPGTPARAANQNLERAARERMVGSPIWFDRGHAEVALSDFQRTADVRGWALLAAAIMRNHVHLVVGVRYDPDPSTLLHAFKGHSSQVLSAASHRPPGGRWWTQSGSRRVLRDEPAVVAAIRYVLGQYAPLVTWHPADIDPAWLDADP